MSGRPVGPAPEAGSDACRVTVCICTFRRPQMLERLLNALSRQQTRGALTFSVVVVDNDAEASARDAVASCAARSPMAVRYAVEARKNIARARNMAVANSSGDYVAFIDDDEFPEDDWLFQHVRACRAHGASGSLGPVLPHFACAPPRWAVKGRFFERPRYPTGQRLPWSRTRTGNALVSRSIFAGEAEVFRPEFDAMGEDVDFFRRMMDRGHVFVWCDEAVVHEEVPASRCTRGYLLKRALVRGSNFSKQKAHRARNLLRSLVAVPAYVVALPVLALFGQHVALAFLIKTADHGARILSFLGWKVIRGRDL